MGDLGLLHFEGSGVARDHAEAARWWERAARASGLAMALCNLGCMHYEGLDPFPGPDRAKARGLLEQAAAKGDQVGCSAHGC